MVNPKLKRISMIDPKLKNFEGNSLIHRSAVTPNIIKTLQAQDTRTRHIENIKRGMAETKAEQEDSSVAQDQGSNSKADDKGTWKIVIGVGLGIGLVTAVGYYALKG